LYGYLPALVDVFGESVILPAKYEGTINSRPELQKYRSAINWVTDTDAAFARATGVVLATAPTEQPALVEQACRHPGIKTLILEKPLAPSPAESMALIDLLMDSGRRYRVGYSLLATRWGRRLDLRNAASDELLIEWMFTAHHFSTGLRTWKRQHEHGGGVLRFFGIHLLALLAREGYQSVTGSILSGDVVSEPERWQATLEAPGLPPCRIDVDSRAGASRFRVARGPAEARSDIVDLSEPFASEEFRPDPREDRRISVLARLLESTSADDESFHRLYIATNEMWRQAESLAGLHLRTVTANGSHARDSS